MAPHRAGHHDEEGNGEAEGEPLADLEEVESERLEGRHEHGPEEVGVALHPLARVEDQPFAMDEVVGVTEGDVPVVFDELEHGQQADAEGDGREPLEPAGRRGGWLVGEPRVGLAEEEQEQGEQHRAAHGFCPALPGPQVGKQLRDACGRGREAAHGAVGLAIDEVDMAQGHAVVGGLGREGLEPLVALAVVEAGKELEFSCLAACREGEGDLTGHGRRGPGRR